MTKTKKKMDKMTNLKEQKKTKPNAFNKWTHFLAICFAILAFISARSHSLCQRKCEKWKKSKEKKNLNSTHKHTIRFTQMILDTKKYEHFVIMWLRWTNNQTDKTQTHTLICNKPTKYLHKRPNRNRKHIHIYTPTGGNRKRTWQKTNKQRERNPSQAIKSNHAKGNLQKEKRFIENPMIWLKLSFQYYIIITSEIWIITVNFSMTVNV